MSVKQKILIVEDEKPLAKALSLKLTKSGFEVVEVHDGQEALDQINTTKFDLILTDLVMPKVDGFHFLVEYKNLGLNTPIIVLSNLGQNEDIKKAKELGAFDFLIKASTPLSKIVELVNSKLRP